MIKAHVHAVYEARLSRLAEKRGVHLIPPSLLG
jgi:hypothetical protein